MKEKKHLSRRDFLKMSSLAVAGTVIASCTPAATNAPISSTSPPVQATATTAPVALATITPTKGQPITLSFTFWGSTNEVNAMRATAQKFTAANPNINIDVQNFANDPVYTQKLTTMIAGGTSPDIAYLSNAETLATQGLLLDLRPYVDADPVMKTYMPQLRVYYGGILSGVGIGNEFMMLYYDKAAFAKEGIEPPPADPTKAWDIHKYIDVAKQMTKDSNGRNALDKNFDPNSITTYGMTFPWSTWGTPFRLGYSNGGRVTSDDGLKLTMDSPEMIEAWQTLQDMVYVHHCSPTVSVLANSNLVSPKLMENGLIVMDYGGHWEFIDYSQTKVDLGCAVIPYFKTPFNVHSGLAPGVFKTTKYPDQSLAWYGYLADPAQCDLYKQGLWAPAASGFYTDPTMADQWLKGKPGVYPDEAKTVIMEFVYKYSPIKDTTYTIKGVNKINSELLNPALSAVKANEKTAEQALKEAVAKSPSYMQGVWPNLK